MHDLFEQHIAMGQLQEAAKLYGRGIREYCTSPKHIIEVFLKIYFILEVDSKINLLNSCDRSLLHIFLRCW